MSHPVLTERELQHIFGGLKPKQARSAFLRWVLYLISFVLISAALFVAFNFNELNKNFQYWYKTEYKNQPTSDSASITILNDLINQKNTSKKNVVQLPPLPQIEDSHLKISTIEVNAPITWNVANTPKDVADNLKNGLIQIKGTALPGETGNVFITGHSSNYPWIKSPYNNVFALLNKVVAGDVIHLKYNNKDYLYKVTGTKVVQPDDLTVMGQTQDSILTLMTCTPVGTSLRRLIVTAKQAYPDPNTNTKSSSSGNNLKMPSKVR